MTKDSMWWTRSWNPVTGCRSISEGCANCYAKAMARRFAGRAGYPADDPFRVTLHEERLHKVARWRKPQRVFVCDMGDLFHHDVPDLWIDMVVAMVALCPAHRFLVLTKRAERMQAYFTGLYKRNDLTEAWRRLGGDAVAGLALVGLLKNGPIPNLWLGVTVENQARADERIPLLLDTPAAGRFVSVEPMLGPVNLEFIDVADAIYDSLGGWLGVEGKNGRKTCPRLDWVICGGETGPKARPMDLDWAWEMRMQCCTCRVPFFFKSVGGVRPSAGHRLLDEREYNHMPETLRMPWEAS